MRALEEGEVLRLDERKPLRITCLFGVLWITRAGDPVDHFLVRGESIELDGAAHTLIAGFTAAVVSVKSIRQVTGRPRPDFWLIGVMACLGMRRAPAKRRSVVAVRIASG